MDKNPIKAAIELCGGLTATAIQLRVSPVTLWSWSNQGRVPKLEKARQLSRLSGIPVEKLRPARLSPLSFGGSYV